MTPEDIAEEAAAYDHQVTLREPRERATAWHAHDSCRCCGACVLHGRRSESCPGILPPEAVVYSPQGFGPARNIVAFTGGDITCRPEFYAESTRLIKDRKDLWVLIETNGYGLTALNLDQYRDAGVDAFWLDIKAFDLEKHKWLTGCDNENILKLPREMTRRGFVLEVLSLYIPGLVEAEELENIAGLISEVDPSIPFTILAFFPQYRMTEYRSPSAAEMVKAYTLVKEKGLEAVRLGNVGVFAGTERDLAYLAENVKKNSF
jgi:pyruvate-formate lyase-activating enzyme